MEKNKKILILTGITFFMSIAIPFWGIGYNENIVDFLTKPPGDGTWYEEPTNFIY